ncbi:beta strand repeat-containing protein [Leptotrichia wadei]|uniref:beta strand repeat-containing protein n=2 Tax=Leptotrichia TaxID=32067 RepID=UPI00155B09D7|nr:YadA-like family protein [Leptotrichia wadei]
MDLGSTGSLKVGPVTINNNGIDAGNKKITNVAPGTADTDAANVSQVKAAKTTVSSDDNSITVTETTKPDGHKNYDLSVDVTKLDAANKSLSNINNDGNKVISGIARKSVDVVAGTNIKNIVKNDVQNSDGTTTTTYTINVNGARVVAGDGVTVATGTPGSNNITDYTVSVKNTTLTAAPGSTTVTAGDNNSYAKAGDVATAITNAAKAAKTEVKSPDSSINVATDNTSPDGHTIYNITIDKSGKVAAGDTKLVTGDTVNTAITNAKTDLINNNPLKFGGDSGTVVTRKLGDQLDIKGGATGATTSGNIAVIADGNNTLNIQLAKNLTGLDNISTNGGNTVINDNGITTPKVTINNAPTVGTDATNKDYVDSTKTKVTSNDSSVVINKTTSGNQDVYDLSVDVTKLDAANKSLSNINNDGNKVISNIARKSIDVVAGTNIKDIVKNDVQNSDGTTTTTYTINANGARVVAGDGVTVATGTPGSNNITDYTVSVKNTTLTAAPGSTTVTAGDNNSYAKAGDVATAITNVGKASKTTVTSNDSSVTVVSKVDSGDGHVNYDLSVDTSKVAANTNLTYKANSGTGLTTTLANGLDFKDGDNTVVTVGPNGEVKYSLNPTVAGINSITTNGGNTVINDNGVTTPSLTLTNSTPLTSSTGGKVTVPAGTGNQAVTGQTVANAINKLGDNTINLKASDGNITTKQSLNKDGGLEFNITGSNGITTTASGDTINITIAQSGLNTSTTGGKTTVTPVTSGNTYATAGDVATAIQNAVNNSGWNAVAGSTGTGTTSGSVSNKLVTPGETVKLQAGDNLNVDQSGGTFTYSLKNDINVNSITAGNNKFDTSGLIISDAAGNKAITTPSGTTYTNAAGNTTVINPTGVVINKSAADPSKSVSLTDNGLDNGGNKITNVAAGVNPTDAVNVSQLDKAINKSTYNGPVVYTNAAGEKIVKVNGNYYKASDVDVNGNLLPGAVAINPSDIQHSLLNADGSTTNPSTLDNVGKGKISSSSKEAINGSQLNNLGTQLGLTVDLSGTGFSNPTFAGLKNVNGSTGAAPTTFKDAVDQTIAKVNEGIIYGADNNTAGTRQQLGSRLTVESGDFASGGVNYKGQNLETSYVSDGAGNGKIIVGITENPEFNSVKAKTFTADDGAGNTTVTNGQGTTITDAAGNKNVATAAGNTYTNAAGNTTTVNSSGVTINKSAADPSKSVSLTNSGLDNGGNRITNIAAGVAPTDAVNVSQLGNAVNNLTTAINASKSEVIGGTNTNVTSSTGSNGQIVYKVDADGTTVSGGSSFVSVTQGTKDANNITDYKVDLAQGTKDKLNSIGTGNIAAGDNNTVTGSTVHNYIQNNPLTYTDDNGTIVTRNLGQNLNIMGRATGPLTTGNIGVVAAGPDTLELRLAENVDLGPNGRVTMGKTVVNDDGIKITGGPSVTSSGIDAGGKKVTNIAEGDISPTSNDAVTGRQVYNAISAGAADKATRAELAGVNNNLTAGIAGVAAMANLPQINDSASNRFNIAVAGGAYKNGRAMALGFSGVSDGGRFVYRASASLNNKRDVAVGLGVGYQFGKRDVMPNELDRMKSMVALIEEQKDSYSRQLKQQLEQESRKNQENSELIRQLMQEVQELKSKSNVSNRSNRS